MDHRRTRFWSRGRSSSEKLVLLGLTFLAIISPLVIDRREVIELEPEEVPMNFSAYLPLLLFSLMVAIAVSCYLDRSLTRFDPYWIHRAGGSSGGIIVILVILALVLKCKASLKDLK